jgi:hypothetical protein
MCAKLKEIKEALRRQTNRPIPETGKWLAQVVAGYFAYHAVPTNGLALSAFRHHVKILWHRQLCRRGQRASVLWTQMAKLTDEFLPKPQILHPWPSVRFAVRTQGRSRVPELGLLGSVRGALSNERPYRECENSWLTRKRARSERFFCDQSASDRSKRPKISRKFER